MVVPIGKVIEVDVTSQDVIHSFSVPSFGVKIDAIPGRLNKTWFKADHEGMFYGQCSNICGIDHAFMPINVRVVSQSDYDAWLVEAKKQFASAWTASTSRRRRSSIPRSAPSWARRS
jgi:cytochrome c oxidase subunit 2